MQNISTKKEAINTSLTSNYPISLEIQAKINLHSVIKWSILFAH